jgi:hypothetical protein
MDINFLAIFVASLVTFPIGFTWYHPRVMGSAWMREIGATEESMSKDFNMTKTMILSFLCSFFIAFVINFMVVHQYSLFSLLQDIPTAMEPNAKIQLLLNGNEINYNIKFRTFAHGSFHGLLAGLFFATPVVVQNALFERRSFKYMAIHAGYWIITCALIGGIICAWI